MNPLGDADVPDIVEYRRRIEHGSVDPIDIPSGGSAEIEIMLDHMARPLRFNVDMPAVYADDAQVGWGTMRIEREGGDSAEDVRFRQALSTSKLAA